MSETAEFDFLSRILCLEIESYFPLKFFPSWLTSLFYPQYSLAKNIHEQCKNYRNRDELLFYLDEQRFYLSKINESRLLKKIQEIMLLFLLITENEINKYQQLSAQHQIKIRLYNPQQEQIIKQYKQHLQSQHSIYGQKIKKISTNKLTLIARNGVINGKLIDEFGIAFMINYALEHIRKELNNLHEKHMVIGFLTPNILRGLFIKIKELKESCANPKIDLVTLVKNSRYLIENITNGAGINPPDDYRSKDHYALITACYWFDELFKEAAVRCKTL